MFDEEPEGDPHGECVQEIRRIKGDLKIAMITLKKEVGKKRAVMADLESANLQIEEWRHHLEQIASLAIEFETPHDGCSAGSLQREAQRALMFHDYAKNGKPKKPCIHPTKVTRLGCATSGCEGESVGVFGVGGVSLCAKHAPSDDPIL